MVCRPARAIAVPIVLIALTLAASSGCAASHDPQLGGRSGSPEGLAPSVAPSVAPSISTPVTTAPPGTPSSGSGVVGRTVIDGGCPVVRAGSPCPDRPIRAHLNILDAATGNVAATVDSDADGGFVVSLPPGRYLLRTSQTSGAPPHRPIPATVTVQPGRYTTVTIRFDSGIR